MNLRVMGIGLALVASQAFGWNELGHMVAAKIAWGQLNPSVQAECARLLLIGGNGKAQTFADAGPWADDIRRDRPETGPWHYINYHFRTDGKATDKQPEAENVVEEIAAQSTILKDRSETDAARADALRFLIHFVADSHQPLHCVARDTDAHPDGDRGGNDFLILPPEGLVPKPKNLHSLWDEGCGLFAGRRQMRPLSGKADEDLSTFSGQIFNNYAGDLRKLASDLEPKDWTLEGLALAKEQVYNLTENSAPSEEYLRKGREISAKRITLAGLRLAGLLNRLMS